MVGLDSPGKSNIQYGKLTPEVSEMVVFHGCLHLFSEYLKPDQGKH